MGQHDTSHPRPLWLSRPIHSELIWLTIPTIISTLAVPLLGIVDTAVLGRLPDVRQLAGATSACVILSIVFQMFFFLRMGTTALVAQRWGADDRRRAAMVLFQSLAIAAVLGLGLIVLRRPIALIGFALVGAPEDVTALGEAYFAVRIFEAPFYLMTLALTALMRSRRRFGADVHRAGRQYRQHCRRSAPGTRNVWLAFVRRRGRCVGQSCGSGHRLGNRRFGRMEACTCLLGLGMAQSLAQASVAPLLHGIPAPVHPDAYPGAHLGVGHVSRRSTGVGPHPGGARHLDAAVVPR